MRECFVSLIWRAARDQVWRCAMLLWGMADLASYFGGILWYGSK